MVELDLCRVGDEVLISTVCRVIGIVGIFNGAGDRLVRHPVDYGCCRRGSGEVQGRGMISTGPSSRYGDGGGRAAAPGFVP